MFTADLLFVHDEGVNFVDILRWTVFAYKTRITITTVASYDIW